MDKNFIDLGQDYGDGMMATGPDEMPKRRYPTLCLCSEDAIELPDGTFKFTCIGRVVERNENERDPEDKKYRAEIEVHSIAPGASVESDESDDEDEFVVVKGKDPVDELEKAMRGEE